MTKPHNNESAIPLQISEEQAQALDAAMWRSALSGSGRNSWMFGSDMYVDRDYTPDLEDLYAPQVVATGPTSVPAAAQRGVFGPSQHIEVTTSPLSEEVKGNELAVWHLTSNEWYKRSVRERISQMGGKVVDFVKRDQGSLEVRKQLR
jgi:hypothetical protein